MLVNVGYNSFNIVDVALEVTGYQLEITSVVL